MQQLNAWLGSTLISGTLIISSSGGFAGLVLLRHVLQDLELVGDGTRGSILATQLVQLELELGSTRALGSHERQHRSREMSGLLHQARDVKRLIDALVLQQLIKHHGVGRGVEPHVVGYMTAMHVNEQRQRLVEVACARVCHYQHVERHRQQAIIVRQRTRSREESLHGIDATSLRLVGESRQQHPHELAGAP